MAKTTDATTENKRKYAYAVLSGVMTRKDAYLAFINPYCKTPTKSASQMHKTKQLGSILEEVKQGLNEAKNIRQSAIDITEHQLIIAKFLLDEADGKSYKERLAILRAMKPIQDNAVAMLKRLDAEKIPTDVSRQPIKRHRRDVSKYIT